MKTTISILLTLLTIFAGNSSSKRIEYRYDNAGNRIIKEIVMTTRGLPSSEDEENNPVSDNLDGKIIKIYPNPTKGIVKVEVSNIELIAEGSIYVYSLSGQTISHSNITTNITEVDISNCPNG
ncbi:MAG: T9SS type A sorting domain-containing protein, partial [Muribaculaceae bacterium]|nr:T9SS type A sorting domain-containing protein [Muribaculaceae bacterium]